MGSSLSGSLPLPPPSPKQYFLIFLKNILESHKNLVMALNTLNQYDKAKVYYVLFDLNHTLGYFGEL